MTSLRRSAREYLLMRRALGFKLHESGHHLQDFLTFAKSEGASRITTELAVRWATRANGAKSITWAKRLSSIRGFARFHIATDHRTEIPPARLLSSTSQRPTPYIYSQNEISRLIAAAKRKRPRSLLRSQSLATLIGLLAATGLRLGEAVRLDRDDVALEKDLLVIRDSKFGKSRLVPIHPSTRRALRRYQRLRDQVHPAPETARFFLNDHGTPVKMRRIDEGFLELAHEIGLRAPGDRSGPRLHDFRHTFVVNSILRWYRAGVDIDKRMAVLSAYVGHTHARDTYWYISAVPELLRLVALRMKRMEENLS